MKGIVRESINFKRGLSDEEIKHNILGYHVGEVIIYTRWDKEYAFMITKINNDDVEVLYLGNFRTSKDSYTKSIHRYAPDLFLSEIKLPTKTQLQDIKEKLSDWDIEYIKNLTGIILDI